MISCVYIQTLAVITFERQNYEKPLIFRLHISIIFKIFNFNITNDVIGDNN